MSESSNSSLPGMISPLAAGAKPVTAKGGLRQEAGEKSGRSFSNELSQALEKQSTAKPVAAESAPARQSGRTPGSPALTSAAVTSEEGVTPDSSTLLAAHLSGENTDDPGLATKAASDNTVLALPVKPFAEADGIETPAAAPTGLSENLSQEATKSGTAVSSLDDATVEQIESAVRQPISDNTQPSVAPEKMATDAPAIINSGALKQAETAVESQASDDGLPSGSRGSAGVVTSTASTPTPRPLTDLAEVAAAAAAKTTETPAGQARTTEALTPQMTTAGGRSVVDASAGSEKTVETGNPAVLNAKKASVATAVTPAPVESIPAEAMSSAVKAATTATAGAPVVAAAAATPAATPAVAMPDGKVEKLDLTVSATEGGELVLPAASEARSHGAGKSEQLAKADTGGAASNVQILSERGSVEAQSAAKAGSEQSAAQPPKVGEIISQSALVARYRHLSNEADARVPTSVATHSDNSLPEGGTEGKSVLTSQAVTTVGGHGNTLTSTTSDGKAEPEMPPLATSAIQADEGEPVLRHADLLKDLQTQRAVLNESMSLQSPVAAGEALVKSPSVDNMFLPLSGGIVTAPVLQRTDMTSPVPVTTPFELPLLAEDADAAMASNVKWMAKEGIQNATVTVSPAGMGPISVKVGIEQDQMSVSIMAAQQTTREALDSMLPRLREQLAAQGHESVKLDVSDGRGEQSRSGNGQMFSGMRNPSDTWSQNEQRNNGSNGNQAGFGHSESSTNDANGLMAEDLQRVAIRTAGGTQAPSAFDAYV